MKNLHSAYSCFSFRANIIVYSLMNSLVYDNRKGKVAGSPLKVFGVALKMKEQCDVSLILGKVGGSQTLFSPSFCVSCHLLPNYRICVKIPPLSNQFGMHPIIATRIPNNFQRLRYSQKNLDRFTTILYIAGLLFAVVSIYTCFAKMTFNGFSKTLYIRQSFDIDSHQTLRSFSDSSF